MLEQSATNTAAHLLRSNPHVFDFRERIRYHERATTNDCAIDSGRKDLVSPDEFTRDGQVRLPLLNPAFGILPVTFSCMRNFSEGVCFLRVGAANLDAHGARSLTCQEYVRHDLQDSQDRKLTTLPCFSRQSCKSCRFGLALCNILQADYGTYRLSRAR